MFGSARVVYQGIDHPTLGPPIDATAFLIPNAVNPAFSGNDGVWLVRYGAQINVFPGQNAPVEIGGGATTTGGVTAQFDDVTVEGVFSVEQVGLSDLDPTAQTSFNAFANLLPEQMWVAEFSGSFDGNINLEFGVDSALLALAGVDTSQLQMLKRDDVTGFIESLGPVATTPSTVTVEASTLSTFGLVVVPEPSSWIFLSLGALFGLGLRDARTPRVL